MSTFLSTFQSKDEYLVHRWIETYPQYKDLDLNQIMLLVNRVESLGLWYREVKDEWSKYTKTPVYLEGILTPDEYLELGDKLLRLKNLERDRSRQLEGIAHRAKLEADKVNLAINSETEKLRQDDMVLIMGLRFSELPVKYTKDVILKVWKEKEDHLRVAAEEEVLANFRKEFMKRIKDKTFKRDEVFGM